MKKAVTIIGISVANLAAGVILFIGLVVLDRIRAFAAYRNRGIMERIEPTQEQKDRFYGQLAEDEFRVLNVGQTVL